MSNSRVEVGVDFSKQGRQIGDLRTRWSNNQNPLGSYLTPIAVLANGEGPTLLLTGGVHGDEFEGPAVLMRLMHGLDVSRITGRLIIIPAANAPALRESGRVSSVDGSNLNRAFPGDPGGHPTAMIAHYIESELLPRCDAVIDLHSGGHASVFAPCVLATVSGDLGSGNLALARAFGAPYLWVAGPRNDNRSLNAAAARQNVVNIAAELGGGGGCEPAMVELADAAITRCLTHLGITDNAIDNHPSPMQWLSVRETLSAPATGLFERHFNVAESVKAGQQAGWLHFIDEPSRPPLMVTFPVGGVILAATNRGRMDRGDMLAIIADPMDENGN